METKFEFNQLVKIRDPPPWSGKYKVMEKVEVLINKFERMITNSASILEERNKIMIDNIEEESNVDKVK